MRSSPNLHFDSEPDRERPLEHIGPLFKTALGIFANIRFGRLEVGLPDRSVRHFTGSQPGPHATIVIHRQRLVRRFLMKGSLGFSEAYVDGDWDTDDLAELLCLLDLNHEAWMGRWNGSFIVNLADRLRHVLRFNSRRGSRRNIEAHYDLGNAFFEAWLDPTMFYSAALFEDEDADLEHAQLAKARRLARLLELKPGKRVLEIGSGWGTFALIAAREFGASVRSITISKEQHRYASEAVQAQGLADRVEIRLEDYRDVEGKFDAIASIEMFEAVGERYWPGFFSTVHDRLVDGGRAGLQIITIADQFFEAYRQHPDFIQHYVFPGGMLPSPSILDDQYERAGLVETDRLSFGQDYARTLAIWHERFEESWNEVRNLGFDERFRRIWQYYLGYCEAGFRTGSIDVIQTCLRRI